MTARHPERLRLRVPAPGELDYRRRLMADPATMAYNRGYDLDFEGYHRETGCIDFPEGDWADWYDGFVGREPERYCAYIARESDGAFIGEVNLHRSPEGGWHDMGIVLEARYRGMGYAEEALSLLLRHAFEAMGATAVRNEFEEVRQAALRTHLACGFREIRRADGVVTLEITREDYRRYQGSGGM